MKHVMAGSEKRRTNSPTLIVTTVLTQLWGEGSELIVLKEEGVQTPAERQINITPACTTLVPRPVQTVDISYSFSPTEGCGYRFL